MEKIVGPGRTQLTIWHMDIACWVSKSTNALSEYVIPIAFPLCKWLHKLASLLLGVEMKQLMDVLYD